MDDLIQAQVKRETKLRNLNQHKPFLTFVDPVSMNTKHNLQSLVVQW